MIFLLDCHLYVINISIEAHALSEPNKKSFRPGSAICKREIKLPGYWLSNFTKVCVTMDSVFNKWLWELNIIQHHRFTQLSTVERRRNGQQTSLPEIPLNIDKSCLVQLVNMLGQHSWVIKSRIRMQFPASEPMSLSTFGSWCCDRLSRLSWSQLWRNRYQQPFVHSRRQFYAAYCKI